MISRNSYQKNRKNTRISAFHLVRTVSLPSKIHILVFIIDVWFTEICFYSPFLLLMQAPTVQMPELRPPTRNAAPNTPAEIAILRAGDTLYEQGKLDEAIARYEEVFKANPDNVSAMNQLADSYFQKKDFQKALDVAAKGIEYRSNVLPSLYATIGNTLDVTGQPQKAVEAYKKGLAVAPNAGTLYYNLGVTIQSSLKDPIQARAIFKQGAIADPNHSGIHFQLAVSFLRMTSRHRRFWR